MIAVEGACVVRARYAPSVLVVIAALLLSARAARDPLISAAGATPSGNWWIERQTDRITGAPISSALLSSSRTAHSGLALTPAAQLQLACFKGQALVRFAFAFRAGATKNSVFGYRFDEKQGHEIKVRFLRGNKILVIQGKTEVAQFVDELAAASVLYIQIRSLTKGRTAAEFRVSGATAAINAAFAGCPPSRWPRNP